MLEGPPRTLRIHIDNWWNRSWGLHDIERQSTTCEIAISRSGSRSNRCEQRDFRYYFVSQGGRTLHTLYLRPENAGYHIDHQTRTAQGGPCKCTWEPEPAIADDGECSRTAELRLEGAKRIGMGRVAGHATVRYRVADDTGENIELSLAPALACEVMEHVRTSPGTLGIPGSKWHYRVADYKAGEPDGSLFRLPAGYPIH